MDYLAICLCLFLSCKYTYTRMQTSTKLATLEDYEDELFTGGAPPRVWQLPIESLDLTNVEEYAQLRTKKQLFQIFMDAPNKLRMPQLDWLAFFCQAWNRFERSAPFMMYLLANFHVPLSLAYKGDLASRLLYANWYFLRYGKPLPLIIPIATYSGVGYYPPGQDTGIGHQTVLLVLPVEPMRRVILVYIDTANIAYTPKWYREMLVPLIDTIKTVYTGIEVQDPIPIRRNIQFRYGSCTTFSFMVAFDLIRSPPSRWEETVWRFHEWAESVGHRASRRRMGTFLVNAGAVFVWLAKMLVRAQQLALQNGFEWIDNKSWVELLALPTTRALWKLKYGPRIRKSLDRASFVHSEALLLPSAREMRRMKRSLVQGRRLIRKDPSQPPRLPVHAPPDPSMISEKIRAKTPPRIYKRLRKQARSALPMPPPLPPFPSGSPPKIRRRLRKLI